MEWKAGDIAICIDTSNMTHGSGNPPPLRLNYEYVVSKTKQCECGQTSLDVGLSTKHPDGVMCKCGARSSPSSGIWWCNSKRFKRKEYAQEIIKQIFQTEEA